MNPSAFKDPGFWFHLLALSCGATVSSGLITDAISLKVLGIALVVLNAIGAGQAYGAPAATAALPTKPTGGGQ